MQNKGRATTKISVRQKRGTSQTSFVKQGSSLQKDEVDQLFEFILQQHKSNCMHAVLNMITKNL